MPSVYKITRKNNNQSSSTTQENNSPNQSNDQSKRKFYPKKYQSNRQENNSDRNSIVLLGTYKVSSDGNVYISKNGKGYIVLLIYGKYNNRINISYFFNQKQLDKIFYNIRNNWKINLDEVEGSNDLEKLKNYVKSKMSVDISSDSEEEILLRSLSSLLTIPRYCDVMIKEDNKGKFLYFCHIKEKKSFSFNKGNKK